MTRKERKLTITKVFFYISFDFKNLINTFLMRDPFLSSDLFVTLQTLTHSPSLMLDLPYHAKKILWTKKRLCNIFPTWIVFDSFWLRNYRFPIDGIFLLLCIYFFCSFSLLCCIAGSQHIKYNNNNNKVNKYPSMIKIFWMLYSIYTYLHVQHIYILYILLLDLFFHCWREIARI